MKLSAIIHAAVVGACAPLVLTTCMPGDKIAQLGTYDDSEVMIGLVYIPNIQSSSVYVADVQGTYTSNGVVPTIRHHGSHEGLFTALPASEEGIVIVPGDEAAVAAPQSLDIVSIDQYCASYPGAVIAPEDSNVHSLADLEGKMMGTPGEHGANYYATRAATQGVGLSESDVTISPIGYTQWAALVSGQVDAAADFTNSDAVQMRLAGLQIREIALNPTPTPLVSASFVTTHKWVQGHPEQACTVAAAMTKTMDNIAATPRIALDVMKQRGISLTDEATLSVANAVPTATVPLRLGDIETATGA